MISLTLCWFDMHCFFSTAKREDTCTQTDTSPPILPSSDSIWTVNEDEEDAKSILNNVDDVNQEITPAVLEVVKPKRSQSAPSLSQNAQPCPVSSIAFQPTTEEEAEPMPQQLSLSSSAGRSINADDSVSPFKLENQPLLTAKASSSLSTQPSDTSLCKTVDGVPLVAEKIVVFSYDSFVAGGISAQSSLPELTEKLTEELLAKQPDYNRVNLLRSTEL